MRLNMMLLGFMLYGEAAMAADESKNVLGAPLEQHNAELSTGFYRDGFCHTGADDDGSHVIAALVTDDFLKFTKAQGNDLRTPRLEYRFPGLKAGDRWCICAARWSDAQKVGVAPPVDLSATHQKALETIPLETLKKIPDAINGNAEKTVR